MMSGLDIFPLCANQEQIVLQRRAALQVGRQPSPSLLRLGLKFQGKITAPVLQEALRRIVHRHPALRIAVTENLLVAPPERHRRMQEFMRTGIFTPGSYVQSVKAISDFPLRTVDITKQSETDQESEIERLTQEEDHRPFEDSETHRLRATFVKLGGTQSVLLLYLDHLFSDGVSLIVLRNEFECFLRSHRAGTVATPDAPPMSFTTYALWQQSVLTSEYFDRSIQYWRNQWAQFGADRLTLEDFPFANPRPKNTDEGFGVERLEFNEEETETVRGLSRSQRCTLFVVLLAGFALALRRSTGKSRLAIWSHLANRHRPGTLGAIGYFVNSHLLGIDTAGAGTGAELLAHVRSVVHSALEHQELPLSHLWRTLQCIPRFPDATVLLDFRTAFRQIDGIDGDGEPLQVSRASLPQSTASRFSNLGVYVVDNRDRLSVSIEYRRAMFQEHGVKSLRTSIHDAVMLLANGPTTPLRDSPRPTSKPTPRSAGEFLVFQSHLIPQLPQR